MYLWRGGWHGDANNTTRIPRLSLPRRRLADEDDELSEVQPDAVPPEVREWLASTFTRQLGTTRRRADEKPKFRSVAHAIRAGIFVDRIYRRVTNTALMQFPPDVVKVLKVRLPSTAYARVYIRDVISLCGKRYGDEREDRDCIYIYTLCARLWTRFPILLILLPLEIPNLMRPSCNELMANVPEYHASKDILYF